jgi:phenylacetate-CoA ligase
MIYLRGNNVYPATIEAIVRRFPAVAEYRLVVDRSGPMVDLRIEVEPKAGVAGDTVAAEVGRAVRDEFLFRVEVTAVPPGSLPRFELKARRVVEKTTGSAPTVSAGPPERIVP